MYEVQTDFEYWIHIGHFRPRAAPLPQGAEDRRSKATEVGRTTRSPGRVFQGVVTTLKVPRSHSSQRHV